MKLLKKNQVIIYVIALMLVAAGYLNYTTTQGNNSVETSMQMESDDMQLANIGDAKLVSSEEVIENSTNEENTINSNAENVENITNSMNVNNQTDTNTTVETSTNDTSDYFVKSKLERDTMY